MQQDSNQTNQETQVTLTEVTLPGDVFGAIYNYLQSKPSAETRQVLNVLDKIVEQAVAAKKAEGQTPAQEVPQEVVQEG